MEFAQLARAESELAARNAMRLNQLIVPQAPEIGIDVIAKGDVADARPQIAPDVIEIHAQALR